MEKKPNTNTFSLSDMIFDTCVIHQIQFTNGWENPSEKGIFMMLMVPGQQFVCGQVTLYQMKKECDNMKIDMNENLKALFNAYLERKVIRIISKSQEHPDVECGLIVIDAISSETIAILPNPCWQQVR